MLGLQAAAVSEGSGTPTDESWTDSRRGMSPVDRFTPLRAGCVSTAFTEMVAEHGCAERSQVEITQQSRGKHRESIATLLRKESGQ